MTADRDRSQDGGQPSSALKAPTVALPKGGGAIRGIGEKFAANPVTGTGSMSIPIATSPGRSGFGPQLSLTYDSGSGNSAFGFGWNLSLPSITRKTDKGLPRYDDTAASDVFILSGAEDLVPVLRSDGARQQDTGRAAGFTVYSYRPRIDSLFARIERWVHTSGDTHWRSISRDNILTVYGADSSSRIADPADPLRVFSWLISETRDDKGNAVLYSYKPEDGTGADLASAHQRNQGGAEDPRRSANRYIKRIRYGNRLPLLDDADGKRPHFVDPLKLEKANWMFEVVFDYGEHDPQTPTPNEAVPWVHRADAFSSYRAGFEVRTARLCRRVLVFHHFLELGVAAGCLVSSTDLDHSPATPVDGETEMIYSFMGSVSQARYRFSAGTYMRRALPPVEFGYSRPRVQDEIKVVDAESLENLPYGVDGSLYQWVDLHGEGTQGVLSEQAGVWHYKRNLSPLDSTRVRLAPDELVRVAPNMDLAAGRGQLLDLAGDGTLDLVSFAPPLQGFSEHNETDEGWQSFVAFDAPLNRDLRDQNLKFVDLDGDGHADILITENDALVWHPSLGERGFGPAIRLATALDEENGPRVVFADMLQTISLADMSGDGLTDIVRIRNGEVCYWPNLGYGRFGQKVTMDDAPVFDNPDQYSHTRLRVADIDGSGTADLIYLHRDGVRVYFNHAGNAWGPAHRLNVFPRVDDLTTIVPTDLLGNGTACLVWSSPLSADAVRPMRYVSLMGDQKPHLLINTRNNLGAETDVSYAPSTKFYLQDRLAGRPWITRLAFPVHVVERVVTMDRVSHNRFASRSTYHHGYFDGPEREFRGFGRVETWDTEEIGAFTPEGELSATNADPTSFVPPIHTKRWYHTGAYLQRDRIAHQYANEYFRQPGPSDEAFAATLLASPTIPDGLNADEEREACRALKGTMLRQEIYADDAAPGATSEVQARALLPYSVVEQSQSIVTTQRRGINQHGVFTTHPREAITYHYERVVDDPRVQHSLTIEVDAYGNVLRQVTVGYGRAKAESSLLPADQLHQSKLIVTCTDNSFTNPIDAPAAFPLDYRSPLPSESVTYELTGHTPAGPSSRFTVAEFAAGGVNWIGAAVTIAYESQADGLSKQRRAVEHIRTLYRRDDMISLLGLGRVEPRALSGEAYRLAYTPGLLSSVFQRDSMQLLPSPDAVLAATGPDGGGFLASHPVKASGLFPPTDSDGCYWVPSGRSYCSVDPQDAPAVELANALRHFFLPARYVDPFGAATTIRYDAHDLLIEESRDALGNAVTVGEWSPASPGNDYRVLQPHTLTDPNGNRTKVAFDTLGFVVGTAVMGKIGEQRGDTLDGFEPDLADTAIADHLHDPFANAGELLAGATTRMVYDLSAYLRTAGTATVQPTVVSTMARETHVADLPVGGTTRIHHSLTYSDGFGRVIQQKAQAESGSVVAGGPIVERRWVGSGWTVFNNKGKPVRKYEPFFADRHTFEFDAQHGVSGVLFYDPAERVIATIHPNNTYEKVVFSPWHQATWDVNDTVTDDPRLDADVLGYCTLYLDRVAGVPAAAPWQTWFEQRRNLPPADRERQAADKAVAHASTPTTAHLDTLGRPFLTIADNGPDPANPAQHLHFATRTELDVEGNQRIVRDAITTAVDAAGQPVVDPLGRVIMTYGYDMLSSRVHQHSMEAGQRWTLNDVAGKPILAWDDRGHTTRIAYDLLRRPVKTWVRDADPASPNQEVLTELVVYGEQHPYPEQVNARGTPYLHFDQAGLAITDARDFKGNVIASARRLAVNYTDAVDWSPVAGIPNDSVSPVVEATLESSLVDLVETSSTGLVRYTAFTTFDALNRPVTSTSPHTPSMRPSIVRTSYNDAGLLEHLDVNLRGEASGGTLAWTTFVANVDYDAKGRRVTIDYGNRARTTYEYDHLTFRLTKLRTTRDPAVFPEDDSKPPPAWPGSGLQDLRYAYDPAGNITSIDDRAQQAIFFKNQLIEPSNEYIYDPLYRLVAATGREHLGQQGGPPIPHSHNDAGRTGIVSGDASGHFAPNDRQAMGAYSERYVYDAVGNFLSMSHANPTQPTAGWTRRYRYAETSQTEDGSNAGSRKYSNRLTSTAIDATNPLTEAYSHDAHGNMTRMPHLGGPGQNMHWNHRDQLARVDLGGGGTAFYTYDFTGERVRKVWQKAPGLVEERIYLGGFEVYRRRSSTALLERETLHVTDDKQRVALVETRTADTADKDQAPEQLVRFRLSNHLGSAALELDVAASIISYEEHSPYGSTTYQAVRSATELPKRYRFAGTERDEESGLTECGARHLAAWFGRWTSCDPIGLFGGLDLFVYSANSPTRFTDKKGRYPDDILDAGAPLALPQPDLISPAGEATYVMTDEARAAEHAELIEGGAAPEALASRGLVATTGGADVKAYVREQIVIGQRAAVRNDPIIFLFRFYGGLAVYPFNKSLGTKILNLGEGPEVHSEIAARSQLVTGMAIGFAEILLMAGAQTMGRNVLQRGSLLPPAGSTAALEDLKAWDNFRLAPDAEIDWSSARSGSFVSAPAEGPPGLNVVSGPGPKYGEKSIWFHDNLRVQGVIGANGRPVNLRTHSADPRFPEQGYVTVINTHVKNPATQGPEMYMTPEGQWHAEDPANFALMRRLHIDAGN